MTEADFRAWIADLRARIALRLAELDAIDPAGLTDDERAANDDLRERLREVQAQTDDDALELELLATEHADRALTPAELRALRVRQ